MCQLVLNTSLGTRPFPLMCLHKGCTEERIWGRDYLHGKDASTCHFITRSLHCQRSLRSFSYNTSSSPSLTAVASISCLKSCTHAKENRISVPTLNTTAVSTQIHICNIYTMYCGHSVFTAYVYECVDTQRALLYKRHFPIHQPQ